MPARVGAEIASVLVITALLVVAGFGVLELGDGASPVDAFFSTGPSTAVGFAGLGFGATAIAAILGGTLARNRTRRTRVLVSLAAGAVGAVVNLVVGTIIGVTGGGWSALLIAFALIGAAVLAVAVLLATLFTYLVAFRRTA